MKALWGGHPVRPKHPNMTFMNLISELNELTLTDISLIMIVAKNFSVEII